MKNGFMIAVFAACFGITAQANTTNVSLVNSISQQSLPLLHSQYVTQEDGIPSAPAPYSAPMAYYFPVMSRMSSAEMISNSDVLRYESLTTGKVLSLTTAFIPMEPQSSITANYGSYGAKKLNFSTGNSFKQVGYLVNFSQKENDGFKTIGNKKEGDSGFSVQDFMGKLRFNTSPEIDHYQSLEFKIGRTNRNSDESYLGLAKSDFLDNPYQRYAATANDKLKTSYRQLEMRHEIDLTSYSRLSTTLYNHIFSYNRLALNSVDGLFLSKALTNPTAVSYLKGAMSADDLLILRNSNRDYDSNGVKSSFHYTAETPFAKHNINLGLSFHQDSSHRLQSDDGYKNDISGNLIKTSSAIGGSAGNFAYSSNSASIYGTDQIMFHRLIISPIVRYENLRLKTDNLSNDDIYKRDIKIFLPGLSALYHLTTRTSLMASLHRAATMPNAQSSVNKTAIEKSTNSRINLTTRPSDALALTSSLYYNDFVNFLGSAASSGSAADDNEQFSGGKVKIYGLEFGAAFDAASLITNPEHGLSIPLEIGYLYSRGEFASSFTQNLVPEWGIVKKGDALPYMPRNVMNFATGVEYYKLRLDLISRYVGMSSGSVNNLLQNKIPPHWSFDSSTSYKITNNTKLLLIVENIANRKFVATSYPYGLSAGKPRTISLGMKLEF